MLTLNALAGATVGALTAAAAQSDVRRMEIPDYISIAIALIALADHFWNGGSALLPDAALGAGVFAAGFLCWLRGWLGGGDVKLLSALSFYFGLGGAEKFMFSLAVASILLGLISIALSLTMPKAGADGATWRGSALKQPMPYGLALASATLATLVWAALSP